MRDLAEICSFKVLKMQIFI